MHCCHCAGFGDLGKETARKAGKTMILSAQMGANHLLTKERAKTVRVLSTHLHFIF